MWRINKKAVEMQIRVVNDSLPQPSTQNSREIKGNYAPHYGGWEFYYYDEKGERHHLLNYRLKHSEAYYFLDGILFSIGYKISLQDQQK